jgi:hypothetical protein
MTRYALLCLLLQKHRSKMKSWGQEEGGNPMALAVEAPPVRVSGGVLVFLFQLQVTGMHVAYQSYR